MTGKPFSSKALRECYAQGAERFGWAGRPLAPRQMRDEAGLLVGWGMGTALFPAPMFQAEARAMLRADGTGAGRDLGASTWARAPGPRSRRSPPTGSACPSTGSSSAPGIPTFPTPASPAARPTPRPPAARSSAPGADAIARLAELATADPDSPLFGAGNAGVVARDGRLHRRDDESRSESYADILARAGLAEVEGTRQRRRDPAARRRRGRCSRTARSSPRCRSIPTSARSASPAWSAPSPPAGSSTRSWCAASSYGGMIWGVSFALHEEALHDRAHRPVDERRPRRVPRAGQRRRRPRSRRSWSRRTTRTSIALGIKGVGEIGITGTVGAIANAVWHATGVRARRFPIRIEETLRS